MPDLKRTSGDAGVILLVEDNVDHAFLVRRKLEEQVEDKYSLVHLTTAGAAVARLAAGDVRCVLLDLTLPDAHGLEALRALRDAAPAVPIVVLTGLDDPDMGIDAVKAGAQDYLVKGRQELDAVNRAVLFAIERAGRQAAEAAQLRLDHRLRTLLESSAEGICWLDPAGSVTYANPSAAALVGRTAAELLDADLHEQLHACQAQPCDLRRTLLSPVPIDAGEQVFRHADGSHLFVELRVRPSAEAGTVLNFTDVTERRRILEALADRKAQLAHAQQLAQLGSWEWDRDTGEVAWSDEMQRLTGLDTPARDTTAFERYLELVPAGEMAAARTLFTTWSTGSLPLSLRHRLMRPDSGPRWVRCQVSEAAAGADGTARRLIGTVQDITEQKLAEDALAHSALHDELTGLPNRDVLLERLGRLLTPGPGPESVVAVLFLDLDQFKWVNDSLSHAAGDVLLQQVAGRLAAVLRPSDTLARFGGDEFVVLAEQLQGDDEVLAVVERLTHALAEPLLVEGHPVLVTASVGIALARSGSGADPERIVRDADIAMYRAKERGRDRYELFDEDMRGRAARRLDAQQQLRRGVADGEITVHFQPVVDNTTGRVLGSEALCRWQHPQRGLLLPGAFIPDAEESGLIVPLGAQVLLAACQQTAAWNRLRPAGEPLSVAVNLSARQLSDSGLRATVVDALEISSLPAALLTLEVTESIIMSDVVASAESLAGLRALGVRVAIDDFGTGYSSLSYLLVLAVDVLKIDRSFVTPLAPSGGGRVPASTAIVAAVTAMASALEIDVVAEGIETVGQLQALRGLKVARGQGYLFGGPVGAPAADWAVAGTRIDLRTPLAPALGGHLPRRHHEALEHRP